MFDTHCHLNFKAFDGRLDEIVESAKQAGVENIVVPGTDIETSRKAVEIAEKYDGVYAAVGIHPHHVFEIFKTQHQIFESTSRLRGSSKSLTQKLMFALRRLIENSKVVAVGEIGIDRHQYQKTKHKGYRVDEEFVNLQKEFFVEQVKLAIEYKKALIIHNREAKTEILEILTNHQSLITSHSAVFHCCEPDVDLLEFAEKHKIFIGVDGDVCHWKEKQEFIKKAPLEMLILETDSPYLSPFKKFPNEPKNIFYISEFIAKLKDVRVNEVREKTTLNAKNLFGISRE